MLASIFGFKGRIGRIRYLLSFMALGPALVFAFVALMFAFGFHLGDKAAMMKSIVLAALAVGPLWFWTSLSLQACRIRDIGWSPVAVILGWMGANFVLRLFEIAMLKPRLGALQSGGDPLGPIILLLDLVLGGLLLLWPGRGDEDGGATLDGDPGPSIPLQPRAPRMSPGLTTGAVTFGRRGL